MKSEPQPTAIYAEYQLSCSEALIAATLALMTGHAQALSDEQRMSMAQKIAANLTRLAGHTCLSPQLRMMLGNLCAHWQLLQAGYSPALQDIGPCVCHPAPQQLQ